MRIANLANRAVLVTDGASGTTAVDVAEASGGRFGPSPRAVFEEWDAFTAWAVDADLSACRTFDPADLGAPVPDPRQVFAIGLNYRDHADEANLDHPEHLVVFTKFASALAGPNVTVELPSDKVDYEPSSSSSSAERSTAPTPTRPGTRSPGTRSGRTTASAPCSSADRPRSSASASRIPSSPRSGPRW